ncbi:MAG: hypothetical protein M1837_003375 [Sclerophora amabilis]|nr:MAG: hypothetical protein M1837_003375 [Sclerophora amabilis]
MEQQLPPDFTSLEVASTQINRNINIMGVVVDFMPATASKGTDFMCSFHLFDRTLVGFNPSLKVRYFNKLIQELPQIQGVGDVVVLRNVKVKVWSGMTTVLSNFSSEWFVYHARFIPKEAPSRNPQLRPISCRKTGARDLVEQLYAIFLCNTQDRSDQTIPEPDQQNDAFKTIVQVAPSVSPPRQKFSLLQDVKGNVFYDLVGQVVKTFAASWGRYEIYVTDYTSNDSLFNYEWGQEGAEVTSENGDGIGAKEALRSSQGWPGPYGKMTLQVTLWEPHAYYAQSHVKEQDFVFLRNVRIKYAQEGAFRIEGNMHTDKRFPERIDVSVINNENDARVQGVKVRKEAYWRKAGRQKKDILRDVNRVKRQRSGGDNNETEGKRKARNRRRARREESDRRGVPTSPQAQQSRLNRYVRCAYQHINPSYISEIIDGSSRNTRSPKGVNYLLPFHNTRCRANVRVVDFFPPTLEDFAVPCFASDQQVSSESESDETFSHGKPCTETDVQEGIQGSQTWEWRFYLLLEEGGKKCKNGGNDSQNKIKVIVAQEDAEFLLDMSAVDLRQNENALARLREKLFVLWGDLEERKAAISTRTLKDKTLTSRQISPASNDQQQHISSRDARSDPKPHSTVTFECCLKEYGVQVQKRGVPRQGERQNSDSDCGDESGDEGRKWERRFRMFGTRIL